MIAMVGRFLTRAGILVFLAPFLSACMQAGTALINLPARLEGGYEIRHAAYGPDPLQRLALYIPTEAASGPRDVIIFFYGGRWTTGQIEDFRFVGAVLAKRGFVTVIPEFRKYPAVRFPTFVEDGARAVAWVDDHIAEHGGRRDRIFLAGHSSGAHIAALLAADERFLAAHGKDSRSVIRAFAGLAGPYAFTPGEPDLQDMFGPPDRYSQMQVPSFIDGREPPMLLIHGDKDSTVGAFNHERLAARIREKGGRVQVITYPGAGHLGLITTFSDLIPGAPVVGDLEGFFRELRD
jgi:acetyl esterase/lipase